MQFYARKLLMRLDFQDLPSLPDSRNGPLGKRLSDRPEGEKIGNVKVLIQLKKVGPADF